MHDEQATGANLSAKHKRTQFDKGDGFAQILHDRSRAVGTDLVKLVLSLSTGTLAIFFLALTGEAKPPLTLAQKTSAVASVAILGVAVFCGIISMYADTRRYYFWACALQTADKQQRDAHYRSRDAWLLSARLLAAAMGISFLLGMLSSIVYGVLRIDAK